MLFSPMSAARSIHKSPAMSAVCLLLKKKALQEKLAKDAAERSSKFDKLYNESMKGLREDIKNQAAEVAKDKDIDLVVVNTVNYPVVLYTSGDNITLDILLKMDGSK